MLRVITTKPGQQPGSAQAGPPVPPPPAGGPPTGGPPPELLAALAGGEGGADAPTDAPTGKMDSEKVGQTTAGYLGPEAGPFACGNCFHFDGKGACAIVQGAIDPSGCCNLFESKDSQSDPDSPDAGPDSGAEAPSAVPPIPPQGA